MTISNAIEFKDVTFTYPESKAPVLKKINFKVKKGSWTALIGHNGSGKSTISKLINGLLLPDKDSGSVITVSGMNLNSENVWDIREKVGIVFQNTILDDNLTIKENILTRAALYGLSKKEAKTRLNYLIAKLELREIINRRYNKLSGGQRRRADVARALIHNPKILILDEPTTGLDPQTRRMLWEVISELRVKRKITVLLTTHYMEEAADADYVVIMDNGKISAEGTPIELKNKYSGDFINLYNVDEEKVKILGKKYEKTSVGYKVEVEDTKTATELILKYPEIFSDYEIRKGKMDDVFLAVTGKKLIEGEKR